LQIFFQRLIRGVASRLGFTVIPQWQESDFALERHLARLLEHYHIDTVLDVGANSGQFCDLLRKRIDYNGLIHSFEPMPDLASGLVRRGNHDSKWIIHNMGLGNENTTLPLNVMSSSVFNSFQLPDTSATGRFSKGNKVLRTIDVAVHRLDDLLPSLSGMDGGKVFLKIDTQGFDHQVILGAKKTIEAISVLQFELPLQKIYKGVADCSDTLELLYESGFEISGLFPISVDEHMRAVEMDCVMVKRLPEGKSVTSPLRFTSKDYLRTAS
jgi:FkbM family methyltransferase